MYLSANAADYSTSRAFSDESGYNSTGDTFASVLLRAAGSFGGGIALTMLLAVLVRH